MSLATLTDVLQPALREGYAVAGLVVLGWEDARAYIDAAEELKAPVIIQAGPGCRAHTPLSVLGKMFRTLGENSSVPVVAHLDHGNTMDECREAIDSGFTSIMFDGSRLPLEENISKTAEVVELAHASGVSCEGEIGFVGYAQGETSALTDAAEAALFARETGLDAMAVSVGNVHLQQAAVGEIDFNCVRAIQEQTDVPLVLHGGSGIPAAIRSKLARETNFCKFNVGTELRQAFGKALREVLANDPDLFDRVSILKYAEDRVRKEAANVISGFYTTN